MRSRSLFNDRAAVENDDFDGLTVRRIDDVRVDDVRTGTWAGLIGILLWISVVAASVGFLLTNAITQAIPS